MGKISQYTRALKAKLSDLFVVASSDNGSLSTKAVTTEQIGDAIITEQTFSGLNGKTPASAIGSLSTLTTTDKSSLVGAVNEVVSTKQNSNVLNIVRNYTTGTSVDALTSLVTEFGKTNMMFSFSVAGVGQYYGILTFYSDLLGGGYFINNSGRFWAINYSSGTFTLAEK